VLIDIGKVHGRATWVRTRAGYLDEGPPYSTHRLVEAAFPTPPGVDISGAELPSGITEMVERGAGSRRVIWYNRRVGHPAQRVGIAHGLHHLLSDLRVSEGMLECNLALRDLEVQRPDLVTKDPSEIACDLFAGEVLVPFVVLDRMAPSLLFPSDSHERASFNDQVDALAATFNVPAGFLRWRLWDLLHLRRTHFFLK
jgi:hypothetical protein